MGAKFEPPPRIGDNTDEDGNVLLTPDEIKRLQSWLERFTQFIADNYD